MEPADRVTYQCGTVPTKELEAIEAKLELLVATAKEHQFSTVPVRVFDLDALLDLARIRKNTSDYFAFALNEIGKP